jgi:hypothetical protein
MLGFTVSQATVSRYLPAPSRRSRQSWRTPQSLATAAAPPASSITAVTMLGLSVRFKLEEETQQIQTSERSRPDCV